LLVDVLAVEGSSAEGVALKKLVPWAVLIVLVIFIVHNPVGAANVGHRMISWLASAGRSFADFFTALV
jgi:hypothetical protein